MNDIDPAKTRMVHEFKHDAPLLVCAFDTSGQFVFAGGRNSQLLRWEIASGEKLLLPGHESWISAMRYNHTAETLLTGDYIGQVFCWDTEAKQSKPRWQIEAHQGTVRSISVSPDGKWLATGGTDTAVRIWSADTGKLVRELTGHTSQVFSTSFHPDGKHLAAGDRNHNRILQWDCASGKEVRRFEPEGLRALNKTQDIEYGGIRGLAFTHDGSQLICCGRNGYRKPATTVLIDWETGKVSQTLVSTFPESIFHNVQSHPNGLVIAAGATIKAGELWFWKPGQEKPVASAKTSGPAYCIDLHPDGQRLAVAQSRGSKTVPEGGTLGIYDMSPAEPAQKTSESK